MRRRSGARPRRSAWDSPSRAVWSFTDISAARPVTTRTLRERQVATLMADGLSAKEIARPLDISPHGVEIPRTRLMAKFSARNNLDLVAQIAGVPV